MVGFGCHHTVVWPGWVQPACLRVRIVPCAGLQYFAAPSCIVHLAAPSWIHSTCAASCHHQDDLCCQLSLSACPVCCQLSCHRQHAPCRQRHCHHVVHAFLYNGEGGARIWAPPESCTMHRPHCLLVLQTSVVRDSSGTQSSQRCGSADQRWHGSAFLAPQQQL